MSNLWGRFSKDSPCPSCFHWDWACRQGERKYICMRVQSPHPSKDGGYYHEYGDNRPAFIPPARKSAPPLKNADGVMKSFYNDPLAVKTLASSLGVSFESLKALEVKWSVEHGAYAAPMRDGDNNIIGIHLRGKDYKKAITGSRNGAFIPQIEHDKICYLPEGLSNTAALVTMGLFAIGRPSCSSGGEIILSALKRLGIRKVCIVGDNDDQKVLGKRPGYEGAEKLKKELRGIQTVTWVPPSPMKGIRDFLLKVGADSARKMIQSSVNQKIWN